MSLTGGKITLSVTASASEIVLAAQPGRRGVYFQNATSSKIHVAFGASATTSNIWIPPASEAAPGSLDVDNQEIAARAITARIATGSGDLHYQEY